MSKETLATLGAQLDFKNWRRLVLQVKNFVKNKGITQAKFIHLDDSKLQELAKAFARKHGRNLWGVPGRGLVYPSDEALIVPVLEKIFIHRRENSRNYLREQGKLEVCESSSSSVEDSDGDYDGDRPDNSEAEDLLDAPGDNGGSESLLLRDAHDAALEFSLRSASSVNKRPETVSSVLSHSSLRAPSDRSPRLPIPARAITLQMIENSSNKLPQSYTTNFKKRRSDQMSGIYEIDNPPRNQAESITSEHAKPKTKADSTYTQSLIDEMSDIGLRSLRRRSDNSSLSSMPTPSNELLGIPSPELVSAEYNTTAQHSMTGRLRFELDMTAYSIGRSEVDHMFQWLVGWISSAIANQHYLAQRAISQGDHRGAQMANCRLELLKQFKSSFRKEIKSRGGRDEDD